MSNTQYLSQERLEAIERLCSEATPGQWVAVVYDDLQHANREGMFRWARPDPATGRPALLQGPVGTVLMFNPSAEGEVCGWKDLPGVIEVSARDARFIAHARADLPALLAEVRRLRALLAARNFEPSGPG